MNRMIWITCGAAALVLFGCSSDKKSTNVNASTPFPYAKPGVETMQIDVSDLSQRGEPEKTAGICHAATALVVAWVNLNVELRLVIPEAALAACFTSPSVYLGNSSWRWTATGGQGAGAWTAELTGTLESTTEIGWEMRISGTASSLNRFLWFDGLCDYDAHSGEWTAYDPLTPDAQNAVITCTWSLPAGAGQDHTIDFENVDDRASENGDFLNYGLADSIATISFYDASQDASSEAWWDLRDGSGQAMSAQGDTCCWGARPLYPDVDCP
jgi:hypothetical protein